MKSKPSTRAYTAQANVFASKLGSNFGRTINISIVAKNEEQAIKQAKEHFNNYIDRISINHNTKFEYNNLKLV